MRPSNHSSALGPSGRTAEHSDRFGGAPGRPYRETDAHDRQWSTEGQRPSCPLAQVIGSQVKLSRNIEFEAGSANILAVSDGLLTDISRAIQTLPPGGRVRIEGHTDSVGTNPANKKIAQARADAVRTWLVERGGISTDKLETLGIGEERPSPRIRPPTAARKIDASSFT